MTARGRNEARRDSRSKGDVMDGFTLIDGIVAAVIILSAILAYSRGFVAESLSILGWIGAAVLAFLFAATVRPMIAQIPYLDRFLGDSCELGMIGSEIATSIAFYWAISSSTLCAGAA